MIEGSVPCSTGLEYFPFQATDSVGFFWPIFTLFSLWNELTSIRIGVLGSISAIPVIALEVLTDSVADRIGRRNCPARGWGR